MRAMKEVIASIVITSAHARDVGRKRPKIPQQRPRRGEHAGRRRHLRNQRRVGRFLDSVARLAAVDRDRCGSRISGSGRASAGTLRNAEGQGALRRSRPNCGTVLATELASRKFSYPRSDGSAWTLALKDVVDRAADFSKAAYNPNDCVEFRWGAPTLKRLKHQPASGMHPRLSTPRWPSTEPGSTSGAGRRRALSGRPLLRRSRAHFSIWHRLRPRA